VSTPQNVGTLYVLANRDSSLAKVGLTRNGTPDARASDYERQHGIQWHVYWSARTCDVAAAEAAAHSELAPQRFSLTPDAREIFHVTPAKAVAVAQRYVVAPDGAQPGGHPQMPLSTTWRVATLILSCWPAFRRMNRLHRLALAAARSPSTVSWLHRLPYRHVQIAARALQTLLRSE
jgi:hypothetical protein